jgi:antitoxin ParD1/3/4
VNISLTPDQARIIQAKLQTGKYRDPEEILDLALWLFDEYERADTEWGSRVRAKIDAAVAASEQTVPLDGKPFVNQVLERFQRLREANG